MTSFWHSIRWRIFIYYTAILIVAVSVLIGGFYMFEKKSLLQIAELQMQRKAIGAIPFFFNPPNAPLGRKEGSRGPKRRRGGEGPSGVNFSPRKDRSSHEGHKGYVGQPHTGRPSDVGRPTFLIADFLKEGHMTEEGEATLQELINHSDFDYIMKRLTGSDHFVMIESTESGFHFRSDNFPEVMNQIVLVNPRHPKWYVDSTEDYLYFVHFLANKGIVLIGMPYFSDEILTFLKQTFLVGFAVVLISSLIGFWIISIVLKPIKQVSQAAERIASGDINGRIDTQNIRSELGQMADVLNKTFGRLGEALKRQIQFTSDASHELRTPVAAILADCQFSLKRERSTERYRETIEVCHESAQHMRSLIEDLRDLADFDEKNDPLVRETVEMKTFLENVVNVMTPLAKEKGIEVNLEVENTTAQFDPMRMKQAIINLLSNAVRYTDETGQIFVHCYKQARGIVIEVKDTGIGIAPDKIKHIFDRFYRSDAARSKDTGGVGLGLSISKSIIEANGGDISVQSELSVGTCFRIRLGVE